LLPPVRPQTGEVRPSDGYSDSQLVPSNAAQNFKIRLAFWVVGALLGFLQAWASRLDADDNAITYLDIGNYFFHGHYPAIVNGFWSPMYSFLLGLVMAVFKPSLYWEYPAVHLTLFGMFLFTMACFDYFLRQLMQFRADFDLRNKISSTPDWVWLTIGYTIFLWFTLKWTEVYRLTTDLLAAGFFYLSYALLLKIFSGRAKWKVFLLLGVALALTYLTKFFLLPICLLILLIACVVAKPNRRYVAISAAALVLIAAPFITALSMQKGKLTYGEASTYDYVVSVNRAPRYNWQGDSRMHLVHPTRQIFAAPAAFEFKEPLKGTFPPQYDITYWYQGIKPQFHIRQQLKALKRNLRLELGTISFSMSGILLPTLFVTFYETGRGRTILRDILRYWFLVVPCVATAILFAVVYYIPQYLAGSFVVLLVCLFFSVVITRPDSRLLQGAAVLNLAVFLGLMCFPSLLHGFGIHPFHSAVSEQPTSYQQVAEAALKMGLKPGDEIASLNDSNFGTSEWAHLIHLQIVAEIPYISGVPDGDPYQVWNRPWNHFWNADFATQEKVLEKFSQTGARAVISQDKPTGPGTNRWLQIGNTGYYLYWLKPVE
jgi:hypothetical protein